WGHTVYAAPDGPAALGAAASFQPDVALLDLGLPRMDGLELARRVRQVPGLTALPLVALTGYGQEEDRRRCHTAGFQFHFLKPVDPELLRQFLVNLARPV